ncbi:hypothetical protein CR103_14910 [Massilia psychrophila]|uniref:PEP-CTERM protein-sorting domain-containing protein n=2 Tax=Massilia psychrophila TaxID=1603353 RepID=A0A2G8SYV5_9BURK|nr:hypothetical protein [Massilia psychrophila]PIL38970.1 hypothetical protein CR103_14910 [Massilia psychrophila]
MDLVKAAVKLLGAALLAAGIVCSATAGTIVYDFDTFDDDTPLATGYAGLTFTNAAVWKAGLSLNETAFSPHSADGVVLNIGGPITVVFLTPVFGVGGYFTYDSGLAIAIYDGRGALLGELSGAYANNLIDGSGDASSSPNEFLQFADVNGLIARITITSSGGSTVVLDDLTVDDGATSISEPSSIALMAGVIAAGLRRRGWLRRS